MNASDHDAYAQHTHKDQSIRIGFRIFFPIFKVLKTAKQFLNRYLLTLTNGFKKLHKNIFWAQTQKDPP